MSLSTGGQLAPLWRQPGTTRSGQKYVPFPVSGAATGVRTRSFAYAGERSTDLTSTSLTAIPCGDLQPNLAGLANNGADLTGHNQLIHTRGRCCGRQKTRVAGEAGFSGRQRHLYLYFIAGTHV